MYGRQRAGVGTFLRLRRTTAVAAFRARKDPTGGKEEDMALGELLFEFAGQAGRKDWGLVWDGVWKDGELDIWGVFFWGGEVPLLNFVEAGEERDGDEDDDCFFAVADLELFDLGELVSCLVLGLIS